MSSADFLPNPAKSFRLVEQSYLSGSQHQIQKQRGHDERNGARVRNHECTSPACPNIITLNYMNDSKVHLFLFVLLSNYFFTLLIID
jgi:hypothetical protein